MLSRQVEKTHQEIIEDIDKLAHETSQNSYYYGQLIKSSALLARSNKKIEEAVNNFEQSTDKTEKIMIGLTIATIVVAIFQILIVFIKQ